MGITRLAEVHADAVEELLLTDPIVHLFLLGFLHQHGVGRAHWYGEVVGEQVITCALVVPGRIAVPGPATAEQADRLGRAMRFVHRPTMMVGPRDTVDRMFAAWAPHAVTDRWHDQRLYVCRAVPDGAELVDLRRATRADADAVADAAARMDREDTGRRLDEVEPAAFAASVMQRIDSEATWISADDRGLRFQVQVGSQTPWGAQVGGTWVPPERRGAGLASAGMRAITRRLLTQLPCVTLHVNEANLPAVGAYRAAGYQPHAPLRLLTLRA